MYTIVLLACADTALERTEGLNEGKVGFIENTAMRHRWGGWVEGLPWVPVFSPVFVRFP